MMEHAGTLPTSLGQRGLGRGQHLSSRACHMGRRSGVGCGQRILATLRPIQGTFVSSVFTAAIQRPAPCIRGLQV